MRSHADRLDLLPPYLFAELERKISAKKAAGSQGVCAQVKLLIEQEAVALGPIELGEAVATGAGSLKARHVIHGAVMGQDLTTNADLVRRTTRRCLEVAEDLGARSLALPAFGTGVGGLPVDECARVMVAEARSFEPRSLERVVFAVFGAEAEETFVDAVEATR